MKAGAGFVSTVGVNALILTVSLFFFCRGHSGQIIDDEKQEADRQEEDVYGQSSSLSSKLCPSYIIPEVGFPHTLGSERSFIRPLCPSWKLSLQFWQTV